MRIFRQQKFMDWVPVFDRIAVELCKRVAATVPAPSVAIEMTPGELIDKITILEIKSERISDVVKVRNVLRELETLRKARDRTIRDSDELDTLTADLRSVNDALWQIIQSPPTVISLAAKARCHPKGPMVNASTQVSPRLLAICARSALRKIFLKNFYLHIKQ